MERIENINSFIVMDIVQKSREFNDSIHFEIGEPDLEPPLRVQELAKKAIDNKNFSYTNSMGLKELRVEISKHYKRVYAVDVNWENILITPGTSGAFLVAYSLTCDYNKNLAFSDPGYPCYKNISNLLHINPVKIEVFSDTNYQITKESLKNRSIDALQISNPANPTGNIYDNKNLKELINYCNQNSIAFISDELYHGLVYNKKIKSALNFSKDVFVINGFSKYFLMPGFRVGWLIVPDSYRKKAEEIAQNIFISAPTISQYSAIGAFDYNYLQTKTDIFKARRDYMYNNLKDIFEIPALPEGAFYIWANISKYEQDSQIFAKKLFDKTHVAITPGIDFGTNKTNKYVRFAYTTSLDNIKEGIKRIKQFIKQEYKN